MENDRRIIEAIKRRDNEVFTEIVNKHFDEMLLVAYLLLNNRNRAFGLVDQILMDLRDGSLDHEIYSPIDRYLTAKVRERCLPFNPESDY